MLSCQRPAAPQKHSQVSDAGSSIVVVLELGESDSAANFAKEESQEDDTQTQYEQLSQLSRRLAGVVEQAHAL